MGLVSLPGASAWLTAPPVEDREMDAPLFRVAVRRRLRMPLLSADVFCPACGDCLDRFCDHAIICPCKGDKTLRHNAVADVVYSSAKEGSMRPEKERGGVLPPRPQEDGIQNGSGNRRPADVWIPQGGNRSGDALDFACTSGLRSDLLLASATDPANIFGQYENYKRNYLDTERLAREAGFAFIPMICEAHSGAWSSIARQTLDVISAAVASSTGVSKNNASLRLAQRTSIALHRANARAVLQRLASLEPAAQGETVSSDAAAWAELGFANLQ